MDNRAPIATLLGPDRSIQPAFCSTPPRFAVEILRGRTQFRERPISEDEYRIGAAGNCHLRLGGPAMPAVHSVIRTNDEALRLDVLHDEPILKLDGRPVRLSAPLSDGNRIEIGGIEFVVHAPLSRGQIEDYSRLSAIELVERIEREEALIREFDGLRNAGAEALLAAARAVRLEPQPAADQPPATAPIGGGEARLLAEMEDLLRQVNGLLSRLQERAVALAHQDRSSKEDHLVDLQQRLTVQLEALLKQLAALEPEPAPVLKASA